MVRAGQKLRAERLKKGLTLEAVSKATKIKVQFLASIEMGEYEKLPASTYAQGFVRNYAKFLEMKEDEILAIFRREFDEEKSFKVLPEGFVGQEGFPSRKLRIQQTAKIIIFVFIALLAYTIFQYRYAIINPPLEVYTPLEGDVVLSQRIEVLGKTDPNATVFVNNDPAYLDNRGTFKKTITLFVGKTTITIKVVNSFGRETVAERHIEVK